MKEIKESKVSARSMEAAMILRLFKDALESERPIVSRMRWEPDQGDGPDLELGPLEPHPSFGNSLQAVSRVRSRLGALVSGDPSEGDKKPVLRVRSEDGSNLDFSMESFDKASLSDDGRLLIMAGALDGGPGARDDMPLMIQASLRLYGGSGSPLRRDQAMFPIRELVEVRRDHETRQLMRQEASEAPSPERSSASRDLLSAPSENSEGSSGWWGSEQGEQALRAMKGESPENKSSERLGWGQRPRRRATDELDSTEEGLLAMEEGVSSGQQRAVWDSEASSSLQNPADALLAAFAEPEAQPVKALASQPVETSVNGSDLQNKPSSASIDSATSPFGATAPLTTDLDREASSEAAAKQTNVLEPQGALVSGEPSSTRVSEVSVALKAARFLPVVFDPLPEGYDEIAFSVEPGDLMGLLAMLNQSAEFEARLTHKEGARMRLSLAAPRGSLSTFNPLVERYAKSGVMIRRAKPKPVSPESSD